MKNGRLIAIVALAAAFLFIWPDTSTAQYVNNQTVWVEGMVEIEIFGSGTYTYPFSGTWDLSWGDPIVAPDDHHEFPIEIVAMDIENPEIIMNGQPGIPSPGLVRSLSPGIDFPAESFFDVFVEVEIPGVLPGETLRNEPGLPLGDIELEHFPLGFNTEGSPPNPNQILLNDLMEPVGTIGFIEVSFSYYYPPETHVIVDLMKGSNILEPYRYNEDLYRVEAVVSGPHEVTEVEFSYRLAGSPDPWTVFAIDTDGSAVSFSTVEDKGTGDGWAGYLDRTIFPDEGEEYEFQALATTVDHGPIPGFSPPVRIYYIPPFPEIISVPVDSTGTARKGDLVLVLLQALKYFQFPAPARIQVFPLGVDFKRPLSTVNQLALGSNVPLNEKSCGPAAAASCLKYFADDTTNGHPELKKAEGDTSKPDMTGEEMARELRGAMGTNSTRGTTDKGMIGGIKRYLESHGKTGWTVEKTDIEHYGDIGDMFDEFEADGEDVMMVVEDTLPNGKVVQHCVTLGSKASTIYEVNTPEYSAMCESYRLDFMDPYGGEGTDKHEYDVDANEHGKPTLRGYKLDSLATKDAQIKKFFKVSPPDSGSGGGSRRAFPAQADPGWIEIDAGMITGGGIVDSFHWDTEGFPGGIYLLEVVMETPEGMECRDLRLFGIPQYTVGADPPTPETPTKLMGSYPNPFNPMTTIKFYLANDTKVDLTIYDAAGRTVRHLVHDRHMHGGTHEIRWNGIKDGGGRVASGVYFYRLRADGVELSSKLVLLR